MHKIHIAKGNFTPSNNIEQTQFYLLIWLYFDETILSHSKLLIHLKFKLTKNKNPKQNLFIIIKTVEEYTSKI